MDTVNKLVGDIHYNPWLDNSIKGQTLRTIKWAFGRKKKADDNPEVQPKRSDDVLINVYQLDSDDKTDLKKKNKDRVSLAQGQGNWLSYIKFEEEITWRI